MGFFDDKKRIAVRRRTGDGFLKDYLLRSEVTDYVRLRVLLNGLLGIGVCTAIYYLGWRNLNFADFERIPGLAMMLVMIASATYAFAISPLFRSAFFCVLIGAFGKNGQYPLTILILNNLQQGPVQNIVDNYERLGQMVVCHIGLQAEITTNRVALLTGPLEGIIEKASAHGVKKIQKAVNAIRRVIGPFLKELTADQTEEDTVQDLTNEQVELIERRKSKLLHNYQQSLGGQLEDDDEFIKDLLPKREDWENFTEAEPPEWTKFKTNIVQKMARRLATRCNEMFNKGVDACRKLSIEMNQYCKDQLIWPVENWFCPMISIEKFCQNVERRVTQFSMCKKYLEDADMNANFEESASKLSDLTSELDRETRLNLHMAVIQSPRVELEYTLTDLKLKAKELANYAKASSLVMHQVFNALLIYFVYMIFRDAVKMISRYSKDIDFNNTFVSSDFWEIDRFRQENGQECITAFTKKEKRELHVMRVFSFPTRFEIQNAWRPFMRWLVLMLIVIILFLFDHYFHLFNYELTNQHIEEEKVEGKSQSKLHFKGKGVLVDYLNNILAHNKTVEVDKSIDSNECLTKPTRPGVELAICWLFIPLLLSFLLQVVFSFIIRRIIFNYYMPFMYPRRARVRLIHFYNKLLLKRSGDRETNRRRIRFLVTRWQLETGYQMHRSIAVTDSWFKLHIVDRVLKIGKCLLCYEYMRPVQLLYCVSPHCKATYCTVCVLENFDKCYACQTEAGLVDSARSQLIPTNLNEIPQELSTSYGGMFINNRQKAQQHRELITEREHTERRVGMQRKKSVEIIQSALKKGQSNQLPRQRPQPSFKQATQRSPGANRSLLPATTSQRDREVPSKSSTVLSTHRPLARRVYKASRSAFILSFYDDQLDNHLIDWKCPSPCLLTFSPPDSPCLARMMTSSAASAARQLPLPTSDSLKKESPSPEPTEPIHDVFLAAPVSPPRSPKHSPSSGLSPPNQWTLSRTPHPTNHSVECSEFTNYAALPLSTYRRPSFDDVDNYFELSPRQPDFCAELIVATTDKLSPDSTNQALYCCQPTKLFTLSQLKMSRTPTNRNDVSQTHANQMSFDMLSEAMMLTSSPEMALHSFDDPNRFEAYPRTPQWQTSPVPYSEDFYARPQPNVNHFETVSPAASQEAVPNDLDQLDPSEFFQDYYNHDISQLDRYIHDYEEGSSSNSQHQSTLPEDMVQFAEFLPTETSSGYVFGADSSVVVEQTGRIPSATAGPYYLTTAVATTSTSSATADSSAHHTTQTASTSQQRTTRTSTGRQTTSNQRYSPYAGSSGNSSDGDDEPTDYRKKRDKNNAASARSRRKRQEKMQQMREEKALLERKNIELRTQAETLENQVSEYKDMLRTFMCKNSGAM